MNPLSRITDTVKLYIGLAMLIALIGLAVVLAVTRSTLGKVRAWQTDVTAVTRLAADNPKLKPAGVALQITALGQSVTSLKEAVARQNAQIDALRAASDAGQQRLHDALRAADREDAALKGLRDQLRAAAAQKPAPGCESLPAAVLARGKL